MVSSAKVSQPNNISFNNSSKSTYDCLHFLYYISILALKRKSGLLLVPGFQRQTNRDWHRINNCTNHFRADDIARLVCVWLYDLVYWCWFQGFTDVVCTVLTFSLAIRSLISPVCPLTHLILWHFCPFFSSAFTSTTVLLKIFEHDIFVAN